MTRTLAPALRIAGAIVLAAGMVHLYADRVIFDARSFGARAALSLADPRVAGFVAERITDGLVAQRRDLVAYRPVLIGTTRAVVGSEAFRAGFQRAVQSAHAMLFSDGAERLALSIPDLGVLVRSALAREPALAARIPAGFRSSLPVQPTGRAVNALVGLLKIGLRLRRLAVLAVGSGVLLLLLGIFLPRDRRRALLGGGVALASAALVLFFLSPLCRTVLTFSMTSTELRPVVAGVWDAFAGGLRLWALLLAGIGTVLASAAASFASEIEIERIGRLGWQRLREPARTWGGEIVRAALLTGIGLLAALQPAGTLRSAVVIAGVLLAFEGLRELFMLVPPRRPRRAGETPEDAREQPEAQQTARALVRRGLVGFLAAGLIGGAVFFMLGPEALPQAPAVTDACNGDRALCGRRLDAVVFPAAHNSMSAAEFDGWMFPNQEKGSVSLLGDGIRALLFDVHYGTPIGDRVKTEIRDEQTSRARFEKAIGQEAVDAAMRIRDRLTGPATGPRAAYLCHGFCELGAYPFAAMLAGVRDFLVEHPGEVLIFVIEDYVTPADIAAAFQEAGLERFVYRGAVTQPFPTLREMIDSDQRLVVFGENDTAGVPWFHPAFETIQETPYTFHSPDEFSCRANRGGTSGPLFQINHWIETTPTPKPSNAAVVNAHDFLLARVRRCQQERGKLPNILAVDFAGTGDVIAVAADLNGPSERQSSADSQTR